MSRLVVVSNRIAPPDNKGGAGGLAVGVLGALKAAGGLWFGWSGETGNEDEPLKKVTKGNITWASFNLSEQDYEDYYCQFSNAVLLACVPLSSGPGTVSASCMGRLYAGECAISG